MHQAQQGGIHGKPASGNHPCMHPPTSTVTVKVFSGKYSPEPILTNAQKGREGLGARICKDSLKQQIRKDQLKNASMRFNVRHKISKRLLQSPHRSRMPEEETADCIGLQYNFA